MLFFFLLLPCLSWAATKDCFERVANHTLIGTVVVTLNDITLTECQNACVKADKEKCRSLMYHAAKKRCYLNSEDMNTSESQFFPVEAIDYYHRTCYDTLVSSKRDSSFDDNCYEIIKGKVLIGIVDQLIKDVTSLEQCKKRCQKSKEVSDIICKSAIYYAKDKECIIASQSRVDIPDLFIEDDQAVYIENTCLNNSGANMKKLKSMPETVPKSTTQETQAPTTAEAPASQKTEQSLSSSSADAQDLSGLGKSSKVFKKPLHTIVELSGYEAPSDTVASQNHEDVITTSTTAASTTSTTTGKPTTSFDAKVIDTYNVNEAVVKSPPATAAVAGYGRRLRDARVRECFTEVRPMRPMVQTRITKAYSLEQCTDICRLCWRCLQGVRCEAVAYDVSRELCALSNTQIEDGGSVQELDVIMYYNRHDC
ncbi:unnamed protein product [Cylicocyclus nassatus]|uniref:Apple domain-containing protein n=1 Tax=Cylicocyclus nassatus TaxID=53992 RepID=A0AA36DU34_CYLNA|nr:unnamed protein product [Cylicocyclus nassatus]